MENITTKPTATKTIDLWSFEDASEKLQAKILDKHRYYNTEDPYWYTSITENLKDEMLPLGCVVTDTYFSGFSSQGDGASFVGKVNVCKYMEACNATEKYKALYSYLSKEDYDYTVKIQQSGMYHHSGTMSTDFDASYVPEEIYSFAEMLLEDMRERADRLYKDLEAEADLLQSDAVLKETFVEGDYLFDESGDIQEA